MRKLLFPMILLFPAFALSAVQAGFPSQPLWVSATAPSEGETIVISTVVINDTSATLRGTLTFLANDMRIGAREFELPSSKSQIHSIEWKPKKGEYRVSAKIEGTSAELSQKETPSISITVREAPAPPSEIEKTISQVVETGSSIASSSAPIIIQTAQNIFAQTETLRNAGVERLENYLASKSPSGTQSSKGSVAGTSTASTDSPQASNAAGFDAPQKASGSVLSNLAQTAAAGALFVFNNAALFYPILALLILGVLYFLARRIRRKPNE